VRSPRNISNGLLLQAFLRNPIRKHVKQILILDMNGWTGNLQL